MFLHLSIAGSVLLAACGGPDPVPLTIKFSLGTDALHGCEFSSCTDYGMGCRAVLGLRVVDDDADHTVLGSTCLFVPPAASSPTLCAVDEVETEISLDQLPTGMAQIQVAITDAPLRAVTPACPDTMFNFDLHGIPRIVNPVPAFAGAVYADIGSLELVDVPLACPDPDRVNDLGCLSQAQNVVVRLEDMKDVSLLGWGMVAQTIAVAAGEPVPDTTTNPPSWTFNPITGPATSTPLDLVRESVPTRWEGALEEESTLDDYGCVLVTPDLLLPLTQVNCTRELMRDPIDGHIEITGLYLPDEDPLESPGRDVFAQILDAAIASGVIGAVPPQGMVIGRVVDASGDPLAGVTVTSDPSGHDVWYITDDGNGVLTGADRVGATRANGYFLSLTPPFGTRWAASHPDGRTEDGDFRAGLIAKKLSLVLIRMGNVPPPT